jgi:hypothetical protein
MTYQPRLTLVAVVLLVLVAGCGSSGPKLYSVSGTVTYNGQPLPDGDIIFAPATPGGVEYAGKVAAGKFSFNSEAGGKKVKILASREEGAVDPQMGAAPRRQYIPEKYSSAEKTELTAEVTASGKNSYTFTLTGP